MTTLAHAAPITLFILALFYYWFGVADRYATFLYAHLGATPFDEITVSRYWMSGLVADGAVMMLYALVCCVLSRLSSMFRVPEWWRVWLACALPLGVGIPLITMSVNTPTLPFVLAVVCVFVALIGLAFALMPASLAVRQPSDLVWHALDGFGLMPTLIMFRAIELPGKGLAPSPAILYLAAFGSVIFSGVWLAALGLLRARLNAPIRHAAAIFISGLCWSYLLLPLTHHLFSTPAPYKYITASANFFASNFGVQLLALILAAGLAWGASRFTQHVSRLSHRIILLPFEFSLLP